MLFMTWNNQISANFFFLLHLNVKVMLKESWRHRNKQWNWNRFVLQKKNGSAADSIRFNGLSLVLLATYISHTIIWTACNYLPPNKRDDPEPSDAIAKATEVGYFHLVNKHRFFFSLFTIAIIHPANISLFVLHIVCCFISFFHFFFFSLFIHLMRSIRAVILFMHINKSHSCRVDFSIGFKTATQQFSKSMQSVCETYVSPNHAPDRNACSVYI